MKQNTLLGIVSRYLSVGYFDPSMRQLVLEKEKDKELTNDQVKKVYEYVADCQQKDIDSGRSDLSIREMKEVIFKMIGNQHSHNGYGSTVSRPELKAIYTFIVNLPPSVFLGEDK